MAGADDTERMSDVAVFVNPAARKGRSAGRTAEAIAALERHAGSGGTPQVVETTSVEDLHARSAALVAEGVGRIVVVGGDGLVHHVVQAVAGSDTVLGVIPVGTGNDFAAALGLPTRPGDAASVALGPDRRIDLLRSESGWAASVATVGFSAEVNARAESLPRPKGSARYSVATVLELPRLRSLGLEMTLDDGAEPTATLDAALIAVANTEMFGGGMRICPDATPDDGLLDITVIDAVGRFDLLRHFGRVFRGTHVRHPAVSVHRARVVRLAPAGASVEGEPAAVRADGEAWGALPLRIEVVPKALRIAAPFPHRTGA